MGARGFAQRFDGRGRSRKAGVGKQGPSSAHFRFEGRAVVERACVEAMLCRQEVVRPPKQGSCRGGPDSGSFSANAAGRFVTRRSQSGTGPGFYRRHSSPRGPTDGPDLGACSGRGWAASGSELQSQQLWAKSTITGRRRYRFPSQKNSSSSALGDGVPGSGSWGPGSAPSRGSSRRHDRCRRCASGVGVSPASGD